MFYPISKTEYINTDLIKKIKREYYFQNYCGKEIPKYCYKIIYIDDTTEFLTKTDGNNLLKYFGVQNPEEDAEKNFTTTYLKD